jgi:hypothetical protein
MQDQALKDKAVRGLVALAAIGIALFVKHHLHLMFTRSRAIRHGFTERSGLKYRPSEDETLSH